MSIKKTDKKFFDVARQRLSTSSRLNTYDVLKITETNQYFLNHFRSFSIKDEIKSDDRYFESYEMEQDDWWDNISYKFYDTGKYWYLLCVLNDVINPYEDVYPGKKIKVLKSTYLYDVLRDIKDISKL